jgi:hypothetical protein
VNLTDRQIFEDVEQDIRLVLDSYAAETTASEPKNAKPDANDKPPDEQPPEEPEGKKSNGMAWQEVA